MFGPPLTPESIKAETAYRLERTKRDFRSARRRERPEQAGPAPAAMGSPDPPAHRRWSSLRSLFVRRMTAGPAEVGGDTE